MKKCLISRVLNSVGFSVKSFINEMFSIQAAQSDKWKYIPSITLKNYLYTDIVIKQEH